MAPPLRIGELLLQANVITPLHLNASLEEQQKWGGRLGNILVRMGALDESTLVQALSHQLQIPLADFSIARPPIGILTKIERSVWASHSMCPLSFDNTNQVLLVAVSDPFDVVGVDEVSSILGVRVQTQLGGERRVMDTLDALYGASIPSGDPVLEMLDNQMTTMPPSHPVQSQENPATPFPAAPAAVTTSVAIGPTSSPAQLLQMAEEQARVTQAILELLIEKHVISPQEAPNTLARFGRSRH